MRFRPLEVNLVIDNLLSNSIKAGAKHFEVIFSSLADNHISMQVCDDGKGIDETISDYTSVFEKGVTTTNGSGLGLYNIKQFVEKELQGMKLVITF